MTARRWRVIEGDAFDVLRTLPTASVDAVVTDPPYGLKFMGRKWDYQVPGVEVWVQCLRVLKPGGHLLAFGGTRTHHRIWCGIEDAGFEIRDTLAWLYGQGFPKSHNLPGGTGTALKPAHEPVCLARKPFRGTAARNVAEYGTGGLNVQACLVGTDPVHTKAHKTLGAGVIFRKRQPYPASGSRNGRWPANVVHDGSEEVLAVFPETTSPSGSASRKYGTLRMRRQGNHRPCHDTMPDRVSVSGHADSGSAARYFYCAKASNADRDEGLYGAPRGRKTLKEFSSGSGKSGSSQARNCHPTVKPVALMRWLVRLVTPPGGLVLDPFCGSGSTGKAAMLEGMRFIGIEREAGYCEIARARIAYADKQAGSRLPLEAGR